jgi:HD-like signal output (HDOD) protein
MNQKQREDLEFQISKLEALSSSQAILQPLLQILRQPSEEVRIDKVVQLVARDSSIAAQCLRLSNSPLFARQRVETIRGAVMTLGIERMRNLLFGICVHHSIPKDKWVLDANSFWRHSMGCALVSQLMASKVGYPEPEKSYLAGLIHDIGILVNSIVYTAKFRDCLAHSIANKCPLHVAEKLILGFTHEESGGMLCRRWGFSDQLTQAVRCHHEADLLPSAGALAWLVHLSDLLCRLRNLGYGYGESLAVELAADSAWTHLASAYPALAEIDLVRFTLDLDDSTEQVGALVDSIFGPPGATGIDTSTQNGLSF